MRSIIVAKRQRVPSYCRYGTKYARVKISGKYYHLGDLDSEDSWQAYRRLIVEWSGARSV